MSKSTFSKIARAIYRALFGEDAIIVPITRTLSERIFELDSVCFSEGLGPNIEDLTTQLSEFRTREYDWVKTNHIIADVMRLAIRKYLTEAWNAGGASVDIAPDEITNEEGAVARV